MITGSVCLTDMLEAAKKGHSAFTKGKENGKIYCNILAWENDEPDKFDNDFSIQLNSSKEKRESEEKKYIGNMRRVKSGAGEQVPLAAGDSSELELSDDLPF